MELKALAVTFALAFLTETFVEYFFGIPMDHYEKLKPYKWLLMYVAAGVGIFLALFYKLDLIAIISRFAAQVSGMATALDEPSVPGMVLTGMAIGRGANFVHDFLSKYLAPKLPIPTRAADLSGPRG